MKTFLFLAALSLSFPAFAGTKLVECSVWPEMTGKPLSVSADFSQAGKGGPSSRTLLSKGGFEYRVVDNDMGGIYVDVVRLHSGGQETLEFSAATTNHQWVVHPPMNVRIVCNF